MDLSKVLWCSSCSKVQIVSEDKTCTECGNPMEDIGFVEDKVTKSVGGSVKPGNCGCGNPRASKGLDEKGRRRYRTQCYKCLYKARGYVKDTKCKICGIAPEDKKDLHADHIDGDRSNNLTKNLQTLCVDCHKYKTAKQQDWKRK